MKTSTPSNKSYINLHTSGMAYVNRIRTVKTKTSEYLSCTLAALRGSTDDVEYSYIDTNVVGKVANAVINSFAADVDAKKKVLIGFNVGDIRAEAFTYEKGAKQGQTGVGLKARLLKVLWVSVDGVRVYDAPKSTDADNDAAPADVPAAATPATPVNTDEADAAVNATKAAEAVKLERAQKVAAAKAAALAAQAAAEQLEAEEEFEATE